MGSLSCKKDKCMLTKKQRLDREAYITGHPVSFTIDIADKYEAFINDEIFKKTEERLISVLDDYKTDSIVYLFMPNHLHLILHCKVDDINLLDAVDMFKQKSGFMFYETKKPFSWQPSYYDHIIRNEKDIYNQVMYILNNPVRAGLVKYWKEYKYRGSTVYDLDSWE
jgi:putative transposase